MATLNQPENSNTMSSARQKARRLLLATGVVGLAALILGIALALTFPAKAKLSEGYSTPIVALVFAKTPDDLAFLTGKEPVAIEMRDKVSRGQQIDMMFPFAYGGLLALSLWCLARAGEKSAWFGIVFALGVIPADIRENLVLVDLLSELEKGQVVTASLALLYPATWIKWGCLAFAAGFLSFCALRQKMPYTGALAGMVAVTLALTWFTNTRPLVAEIMALITSIFFIFLSIRSMMVAIRVAKMN